MTTISRDPQADDFPWFASTATSEHSLLDIADRDDITEDELLAQAAVQRIPGPFAVVW